MKKKNLRALVILLNFVTCCIGTYYISNSGSPLVVKVILGTIFYLQFGAVIRITKES